MSSLQYWIKGLPDSTVDAQVVNTGSIQYWIFGLTYVDLFGIPVTDSVGSASGTGAATAVGLAQVSAVGSAAGSGAATATSNGTVFSVGSASGAGTAQATANVGLLSIGTASGAGAASGVTNIALLSIGTAAGAGSAFGRGIEEEFLIATSHGQGLARATGIMVGRVLPFDIDRAWAIDINGATIDAVQYDPITLVLRVIYVPVLTVDVGNLPYSITNTIANSPDPEAFVLGLVASAAN